MPSYGENLKYAEALAKCTGSREVTVVDGTTATYQHQHKHQQAELWIGEKTMIHNTTEWYELESSRKDLDDWYATNDKSDSLKSIRKLKRRRTTEAGRMFAFRIIRKVLTEYIEGE